MFLKHILVKPFVNLTEMGAMNPLYNQTSKISHFFLVNNNTYQNTYEKNNSVLNRVYNTLHNQNTTTKGPI